MKKHLLIIASVFSIILLTGCAEPKEEVITDKLVEVKEPLNGVGVKEPLNGIVAGDIQSTLFKKNEQIDIGANVFTYEVKNQTTEVQNLTFTSGMEYDFKIHKKDGEEVYHFSILASFIQAIKEVELKQGESLSYDIEVPSLEKGEYTLNVWLTPQAGESYHQNLDFQVN